MIIKTYIVPCPHCGAEKRVAFSTYEGVSDHYVVWSDGRLEGCRLQPAYIQQCPVCGRFFLMPVRSTLRVEDQPGTDTGFLTYPLLKQAVAAFAGDELPESLARFEAWHAYNMLYKDTPESDIPAEEKEYNKANMLWILEYHSKHTKRFSYIVFELNRLLGNREECERMIAERTFERYVSQREERLREKGQKSTWSEKELRDAYEWDMHNLTASLTKPLVPYAT